MIANNRFKQLKEQAAIINNRLANIPTGEKNEKKFLDNKAKIMRYFNISEEEWHDWKWQMQNRITNANRLADILQSNSERLEQISKVEKKYYWAVSPFYLSLMIDDIINNPLAALCIPDIRELLDMEGTLDPMNENEHCPAGRITRRYPDRLILNVTNECGSFCRFCQRKRNIKKTATMISESDLEESIQYIRNNSEIRDVLITGGDPLTLSDVKLQQILQAIREIKHVEIIRLGTRIPIYIPMRITLDLCNILKKYSPVYVNIHANHPMEINYESSIAIEKLVDSGIPVSNQMVLLNSVNNDPYTVLALNRELLKVKVRPYYVFHPKTVKSTMHFQCSISEGLQIMEMLRGRISGLGIPTYVINCNGGWGKVPLLPNYILNNNQNSITMKTWENKVITLDLEHPDKYKLEEKQHED